MSTNKIPPRDEKFAELCQKTISLSLNDIGLAEVEKSLLADLIENDKLCSLASKWNFSQNTARYYLNSIKTTIFNHVVEQYKKLVD
jgi:hypothetical protein